MAFDGVRFAHALIAARRQLGRSTRDIAKRADVSQPYVVALERAARGVDGPTPTIDVLVRLAAALDLSADELFTAGLRLRASHVLLVTEGSAERAVEMVRAVTATSSDAWVVATSDGSLQSPRAMPALHPCGHDTHADDHQPWRYDPAAVAAALAVALGTHAEALGDSEVGMLFADTSQALAGVCNPEAVLNFEHRWGHIVDRTAADVGMRPRWNVCRHQPSLLRRLPDPLAAARELIASHDDVWVDRDGDVLVGQEAAAAFLTDLAAAA